MYYFETVEKSTLELLKRLMSDRQLNSFLLVGGTALALRLGHRMSVDIDFNVPIKLTGSHEFYWDRIEKRILEMANEPDKVFETL